MTGTDICEVIVTGPTGGLVPALGRELVDARLAASVNVLGAPVESTYWWRGRVETATESRMHLLTRTDLVDHLVAFIRARHPYEVPNVTAMPILAGNADFIAWVRTETASIESLAQAGAAD
jgi:periplasmic divalent cation tolerance protein